MPHRLTAMSRIRGVDDQHRVTTFELFFDLVYVFAITRVTGYMAEAHSGEGVLQGVLLLWLLWWTWSGYSWLGNQARADEGLTRAAMLAAMAAIFVVALTIPEAWHDAPGGLNGPVVLVAAYFFVRSVHLTVYAVAAVDDGRAALRSSCASARARARRRDPRVARGARSGALRLHPRDPARNARLDGPPAASELQASTSTRSSDAPPLRR